VDKVVGTHKFGDGFSHGPFDIEGAASIGEMEQQDVAGGALDQGAHCRLRAPPQDQVTFPVTRNGAVLHLLGTLTDHHHVADPTRILWALLRAALGPARPQATGELTAQLAAALN
jgi:hypothetical protein